MLPNLYLTELFTWLKTNNEWSKAQKFKLVCWLFAWIYTSIAILVLVVSSIIGETAYWTLAGLYALNYPALWFFKPRVVKNHAIYWRRESWEKH